MSETESSNKYLTPAEMQQILQILLEQFDDGKLKKGAITDITNSFNVHRNILCRLWKRANKLMENGSNFMDVSLRKRNCGQKN